MINRITAIANEALRERWSTVLILTALLTGGKAYSTRDLLATDAQAYLAQVFLAVVISFVLAMTIHIILYLIFSPKAKIEQDIAKAEPATPVKSREEHEATVAAVHEELVATKTPSAQDLVMADGNAKPVKRSSPGAKKTSTARPKAKAKGKGKAAKKKK